MKRSGRRPSATRSSHRHHRAAAPGKGPAQPAEPLTERERDTVRRLARGLTHAEIAGEPFVSLSTVKTHPANVRAEPDARNRVEIAAWARESGLATTPA